jgi:hypothetical protein
MANNLIKSTVLYGEHDVGRVKNGNAAPSKIMTMKDLVAPQTIPLFTISYELLTNGAPNARSTTHRRWG